ncbi:MAG: hypothetical protein JWP14_372 [Frankiales bacterium]|nr:hypothetical protein [Frankiales bacterium]
MGESARPGTHPDRLPSGTLWDVSEDRCIHDMIAGTCGTCTPRAGSIDLGQGGTRSNSLRDDAPLKQESLTRLCRLLGLPALSIGVGSSVPSEVFDEMVRRFGVPDGGMPEVGEAVALKAGLQWDAACDSRGTLSGGGSTVTAPGLARLVQAVMTLLR